MSITKSILVEYGLLWGINRLRYSAKLKLLCAIPHAERLYEKNVQVRQIDGLFQPDIDMIKDLLVHMSEKDKKTLIFDAEEALIGRIEGFSAVKLDFGNPIDWQLNPLTGGRCSEKLKWYVIPDFDEQRGDIKVIWEASRLTHFYLFARAYLLSGDLKFYHGFSKQLSDWLNQNPYGYGANFKCGQECALRMVNVLLTYTVFKAHGLVTKADDWNVRTLIEHCYRKILSNFSYAYRCIKNNHTISELMGMIVGAWCCEDKKNLNKAYRLLNKVIVEQFTEDGGYCQFSFNYQRLALQDICHILGFTARTGHGLTEKSAVRIQRSALMIAQCMNDNGEVPNYGANDGALILPMSLSGYQDFRPTVNAVWALTNGNLLWKDHAASEELFWHGVHPHRTVFEVRKISKAYADSGIFTLRNDNFFAMILLNHYKIRPSHMDQLHIDIWVNGCNILSDSGTYSYANELGRALSSTSAHNVVKVDELEQMNRRGMFMVHDWTKRRFYNFTQSTFIGEMQSRNGYVHTRKVVLTSNALSIEDIVDAGDKEWKVLLHTPLEVSRTRTGAIFRQNDCTIAQLKYDGQIEISSCNQSQYYLKTKPATQIALVCPKDRNKVRWNISLKEDYEHD